MSEKKILVVDDEVAILDMLKEIFTMSGYQVVAAESAYIAVCFSLADNFLVNIVGFVKIKALSALIVCFSYVIRITCWKTNFYQG